MNILAIIAVAAAIIGLIVAVSLATWVGKADEGNDRMKEIAGYIREGAMAFLTREYKIMAIVIVVLGSADRFRSPECDNCDLICIRSTAVSTGRILRNEGRNTG